MSSLRWIPYLAAGALGVAGLSVFLARDGAPTEGPPPPARAAQAAPVVDTTGPGLALPIACEIGVTCEIQNYVDRDPSAAAGDYRCGTRSYQDHSGLDIRLPDMAAQRAGVDVLAAAAGTVLRIRDGVADVSVRTTASGAVSNQECGNGVVIDHGGGLVSQSCHMAQGSIRVAPGDTVGTGQPIGRVGLSGNTEYPHLHFTLRQDDAVIDPFAPDVGTGPTQCGTGPSMWRADAAAALAYTERAVINVGFSAAPVTMEQIEAGGIAAPDATSSALVAYARAIGLKAGDVESLILSDASGQILGQSTGQPLPRDQAQRMMFVGKRLTRPAWPGGEYVATYTVTRDGREVLSRRFSATV